MSQSFRFIVRAQTGYDFGHLAPRDHGVIEQTDDLAAARAARDAYANSHRSTNSGAAFAYAMIIDRQDEYAVIGLGHYGNGQRITSVRPILAVAASDDVLLRGSRAECSTFAA